MASSSCSIPFHNRELREWEIDYLAKIDVAGATWSPVGRSHRDDHVTVAKPLPGSHRLSANEPLPIRTPQLAALLRRQRPACENHHGDCVNVPSSSIAGGCLSFGKNRVGRRCCGLASARPMSVPVSVLRNSAIALDERDLADTLKNGGSIMEAARQSLDRVARHTRPQISSSSTVLGSVTLISKRGGMLESRVLPIIAGQCVK